jgi:transcriptional regulator with XRE-family HTH domain
MQTDKLARNLRLLRASTDISIPDLSLEAGVGQNKILRLLDGNKVHLLPEELDALCGHFNVSEDELLNKDAVIIFI